MYILSLSKAVLAQTVGGCFSNAACLNPKHLLSGGQNISSNKWCHDFF